MGLFGRILDFLPWRWAALPFGRSGERAAERFLRRLGYEILARNVSIAGGEIDLIARDGETIVFVEVKSRRHVDDGHPAEFVDVVKQRQLTRLALAYLNRQRWLDLPARFDVVAVTWPDEGRAPTIDHFINAFDAVGGTGMYS